MKANRYPVWSMRIWQGMLFGDWLRLVRRNRFRIHWRRAAMASTITGVTVFNSLMHRLQVAVYSRDLAQASIESPPIFIVGHWRTGTSFLHELLVLDESFAFPTTFECFAPNHFLVTGRILPRLVGFLVPSQRPMDDMALSFAHPQEDEFALVNMGAPSPLLFLAFPNEPPPYLEFLDMQGVDPADLARWKSAIVQFVRMQSYLKHKPLVLKSPTHTGRIAVLAELFPNAKFVHIVRDPCAVFPSTRRLWRTLQLAQGLQLPRYEHLDEFVYGSFERMYRGFERQRAALGPGQICDVRYEDLVRDPVEEIRRIYDTLGLGDFDRVREPVQHYLEQIAGYRAHRYDLSPNIRAEIRRRWGGYMAQYGYEC